MNSMAHGLPGVHDSYLPGEEIPRIYTPKKTHAYKNLTLGLALSLFNLVDIFTSTFS